MNKLSLRLNFRHCSGLAMLVTRLSILFLRDILMTNGAGYSLQTQLFD